MTAGHQLVVHDLHQAAMRPLVLKGAQGGPDLAAFVRLLRPPRAVWLSSGAASLTWHAAMGVDVEVMGETLQSDGSQAFAGSWKDLLQAIDTKTGALKSRKVG